MLANMALLAVLVLTPAAQACVVPDDGSATWRRAVARVKYLPETEAWSELRSRDRAVVQYVLSLDEPKRLHGRCYWPVEVRADGKLWKRFLVAPDGGRVLEEQKR